MNPVQDLLHVSYSMPSRARPYKRSVEWLGVGFRRVEFKNNKDAMDRPFFLMYSSHKAKSSNICVYSHSQVSQDMSINRSPLQLLPHETVSLVMDHLRLTDRVNLVEAYKPTEAEACVSIGETLSWKRVVLKCKHSSAINPSCCSLRCEGVLDGRATLTRVMRALRQFQSGIESSVHVMGNDWRHQLQVLGVLANNAVPSLTLSTTYDTSYLHDALQRVPGLKALSFADTRIGWRFQEVEDPEVFEDIVWFLDIQLNANLNQLTFWEDFDGFFDQQDIAQWALAVGSLPRLTHLDLANTQITEHRIGADFLMQVLERLPNLTFLDVSCNPTAGYSGLPAYNCTVAQLSRGLLPLSQLTTLNLSGCCKQWKDGDNLMSSAIGSLINLTSLDLSDTNIGDTSLDGSTHLADALRPLIRLKTLNLSFNRLLGTLRLALLPLHSLTSIRLGNNFLGTVRTSDQLLMQSLHGLTGLTSLDLGQNSLGLFEIALKTLTSLTHLNISKNTSTSYHDLEHALLPLTRLVSLKLCDGICLTDGSESLIRAFDGLTELTSLEMCDNYNLCTCDGDMYRLSRLLAPLIHLTELSLAGSNIGLYDMLGLALSPLSALTSLDLSSNQLVASHGLLDALRPLIGLRRLNLRGNGLFRHPTDVSLETLLGSLTLLTYLDLCRTDVPCIELAGGLPQLRALTHLDLNSNRICMRECDMGHIAEALRPLTHLTCLKLAYNFIGDWVDDVPQLADALVSKPLLVNLDICDNHLSKHDGYLTQLSRLLKPLERLTFLGLWENAITGDATTIAAIIRPLKQLRTLAL